MRYSASQMRRLMVLPAAVLLAGAFLLGYGLPRGDRAASPVRAATVVDEVREALASGYYRPVSPRVLRLGSVDAMLAALGDPYTAYLPRADYALLRQEAAGSYVGIGVSVVPARAGLLVVATRPGPARAAGIRVGDTILRIAGADARRGATEALARITRTHARRIRLELLRAGRVLRVSVAREHLRVRDVQARLLSYAGRRWGHVRLARFDTGAARSLRREIELLERRGAAGLVLDLRDDPGGLLDEAVGVASLFLDRGVVVSLRGAHRPPTVYRASGEAVSRLPLVVLVDRSTASSAEIVAAALRDHHRAAIVGERTYGKALVQTIDPLGDGGALALTVAHYYTASGTDISGVGVAPDVRAVDRLRTPTDEALTAALQTLARPTS